MQVHTVFQRNSFIGNYSFLNLALFKGGNYSQKYGIEKVVLLKLILILQCFLEIVQCLCRWPVKKDILFGPYGIWCKARGGKMMCTIPYGRPLALPSKSYPQVLNSTTDIAMVMVRDNGLARELWNIDQIKIWKIAILQVRPIFCRRLL